jgi:acetolactate synthase I/II/III large subunit
MPSDKRHSVDRRDFMKHAAAAGAAAVTAGTPIPQAMAAQGPMASSTPSEADSLTQTTCGSDFMVDVIKALNVPYVCGNPGSSFRGLHESIVNYGGNTQP